MRASPLDLPPRSILFVPGDRADSLLTKALAAGPDAIVLDLEDAVAPASRDMARRTIRRATASTPVDRPLYLRLSREPGQLQSELALAAAIGVSAIILPKSARPEEIEELGQKLSALGSHATVMALIETAAGLLAAGALAAVPAISGLILGGEDLRLDLQAQKTRSGREILYARSHLVAAARAAGCWAFDTVCLDIATPSTVAGEARLARQLGFDGKLVIHPNQIASVNRAFTPSDREIREARELVAAYDEAIAGGHGVLALNGKMVDAPVVAAARRVLARAG